MRVNYCTVNNLSLQNIHDKSADFRTLGDKLKISGLEGGLQFVHSTHIW